MFAIWRKQSSLTSAKSRTRWSWIKNCTTIWNRFSIPYIFISFIFRIQLRSGYQAACWLRILGLRAFGEEMLIESILTTFMIVKKGFWYQSQNYGPPQSSREASFHMISLETQSFGGPLMFQTYPLGGNMVECSQNYILWFRFVNHHMRGGFKHFECSSGEVCFLQERISQKHETLLGDPPYLVRAERFTVLQKQNPLLYI